MLSLIGQGTDIEIHGYLWFIQGTKMHMRFKKCVGGWTKFFLFFFIKYILVGWIVYFIFNYILDNNKRKKTIKTLKYTLTFYYCFM